MIKLFTIGFTQKSAQRFFDLLQNSGVDKVIDTRVNNTSQLSGYAKGSDLSFFLREIGDIAYEHNIDFAPTKALLKQYRNRELTWQEYENEFLNLIDMRQLRALVEENGRYLFGTASNFLLEAEIDPVCRSLVMVKAGQPQAYFCTPYNTKPRLKFCYRGSWYNFPITDVNFIDRMQEEPDLLEGLEEVFLTVSLGVQFERKYYKLAAGILRL